ncbi:PRC-barrel domain-containing protein [Microvirga massiliensis]|uniref:PRC-barrel domain-containing protein n=1 Tax=Microvirga massiliensis TaxID=1033741 RepID=UPI0007C7115B
MAQTDVPGVMAGKPLIESDRVEGTTVSDLDENEIGTIKRLMIEENSGRVAYAVLSFGGFLGMGEEEHHFRLSRRRWPTPESGRPSNFTISEHDRMR